MVDLARSAPAPHLCSNAARHGPFDGRTAANHPALLDAARRGVRGLRRKDAARALCAAGQALAGGALAGATDAGARVHRRAGGTTQDARAAALALALRPPGA